MKKVKAISVLIITLAINFIVCGQKLPEKQQTGLWVSAKVKVDGKVNEWRNGFKAFNSATGIYYTMANDDQFLYLAIQAKDPDVINRIVDGGITLSIKGISDESDFSVTYPVSKQEQTFKLRTAKGENPIKDQKETDTLMMIYNKRLDQNCKSIILKNKNGVDTISIFNDNGIKAAGYFDNNKCYNIELAISLKSNGFPKSNSKIAYHLIENGAIRYGMVEAIIPPGTSPEQAAAIERFTASTNERHAKMMAPTDFKGEYIFQVKK